MLRVKSPRNGLLFLDFQLLNFFAFVSHEVMLHLQLYFHLFINMQVKETSTYSHVLVKVEHYEFNPHSRTNIIRLITCCMRLVVAT